MRLRGHGPAFKEQSFGESEPYPVGACFVCQSIKRSVSHNLTSRSTQSTKQAGNLILKMAMLDHVPNREGKVGKEARFEKRVSIK